MKFICLSVDKAAKCYQTNDEKIESKQNRTERVSRQREKEIERERKSTRDTEKQGTEYR